VFFDIGSLEFIALIILAILVFGPEKLPKMIQDTARFVRKVRDFSDNAKQDIRSELGPEFKDFEFDDLNPRTFAKKHLLDNEELGLKELRSSLDVRKELAEVSDAVNGRTPAGTDVTEAGQGPDPDPAVSSGDPVRLDKERPAAASEDGPVTLAKGKTPARGEPAPYDADAT
jgi:sec-independent protein translocase protein TatB